MGKRELPEGWEWKRLGEAADINMGQSPSGTSYNENGNGTPFLQGNAEFGDTFPKHKKFTTEPSKIASKSSVLISVRAPVGDTNIADLNYCIGRGLASISLKNGDNKYLLYLLRSMKPMIEAKGTGSTFKAISKSILFDIEIPLPPLPIQRDIVAVLEKAEAVCKQRQEADALTRALLQSVFFEMFGDPVINERGWKAKKLKEISEVVSGVTKGRKFNGKPTVFVPYLRVANVQDGFLDLTEIKDIEVLDSDIEKFQLKKGDVILTEGGDRDKLGRGHVWYEEIPVCIHQNHIFRVRLNEKLLNPEFFSFLIGSAYGKKYFAKSAKQTTGIASINSNQLKNFPALLPPLALQQKFACIAQDVERIREQQVASGRQIEGLCEGLMQRAFAGELAA